MDFGDFDGEVGSLNGESQAGQRQQGGKECFHKLVGIMRFYVVYNRLDCPQLSINCWHVKRVMAGFNRRGAF
jgi:hypothetical protein